jgi:hypothetical protein
MMFAVGVFSVAGLALATMFLFSIRSFGALANYAILDQQNRQAMDQLTREIRQAKHVTSYSTNPPSITVLSGGNDSITYSFDPSSRQMLRTTSTSSKVLLTNCSLLHFTLYQRNPKTGFELYDIASNNVQKYVKAIELTWKTSKALNPTTQINSENVQTARIVIRKQQDD